MTLIDWHAGPVWVLVWKWGLCFRVYGHGLHIKPAKGHVPVFSERYGLVRPLYVFGLRIQRLRPR